MPKTCQNCQCAEDHKGELQRHVFENILMWLCYDCWMDREEKKARIHEKLFGWLSPSDEDWI